MVYRTCLLLLYAACSACQSETVTRQALALTAFERPCERDNRGRCVCAPGFRADGDRCRDENECTLGLASCQANARCVNQPGSFRCECKDGYTGDAESCADRDECALGTALCDVNATCENTLGSYRCQCAAGYAAAGLRCEDIDECATNPCTNNQSCTNTPGGFVCACRAPYFASGADCRLPRAFVLDDGGSFARFAGIVADEVTVLPATDAPVPYYSWDGALPEPKPDVIVWLQGINYNSPVPPTSVDAIRAFVDAGGGLVRTEWAAWTIAAVPTLADDFADDLMPVGQFDSSVSFIDTNEPVRWSVLQANNALTRGLPKEFVAKGSVAQVALKPSAKAVLEVAVDFSAGPKRVPALSYIPFGGGMVVHVNHDLLYHENYDPGPLSVRLTEPALARVFKNAILFAAQSRGAPP